MTDQIITFGIDDVEAIRTGDRGRRLQEELAKALYRGVARLERDGVPLDVVPHPSELGGVTVIVDNPTGARVIVVDGTVVADGGFVGGTFPRRLSYTYTRTSVYAPAPCGADAAIPNEAYADWVATKCELDHDHAVTVDLVDGVPTCRWADSLLEARA